MDINGPSVDVCNIIIMSTTVVKFSRNGIPPPVFSVPPPEIAVPSPKVVVPPPGNDVPSPLGENR